MASNTKGQNNIIRKRVRYQDNQHEMTENHPRGNNMRNHMEAANMYENQEVAQRERNEQK